MERIPLNRNATGRALLLVTLALLALGVVMVHSAVASVLEPGKWYARVDLRHTVFASRRVKDAEATRGFPVVALTAHAMTTDREKALEAGCDAYETKPVELPRLLETMEKLLA